MANLTIEQSSEYILVMSTCRLKTLVIRGILSACLIPLIPAAFFAWVGLNGYYKYLSEQSNQGYLYEMNCKRLEKNFVNCKLERTDIEGKKVTVFSAPIKSATYAVVTTDVYTCSVSLVKRDGNRLNNLELFTNVEGSDKCPQAKAVVDQINRYILGDGNQPLSWRRDQRVGDLTKDFIKDPGVGLYATIIGGFYGLFSIPRVIYAIFGSKEEFWKFNTRSGQVYHQAISILGRSEHNFSLNLIQEIVIKLKYANNPVIIEVKDSTKKRNTNYEMQFRTSEEQIKVVNFLENATGLEAREMVYTADDD